MPGPPSVTITSNNTYSVVFTLNNNPSGDVVLYEYRSPDYDTNGTRYIVSLVPATNSYSVFDGCGIKTYREYLTTTGISTGLFRQDLTGVNLGQTVTLTVNASSYFRTTGTKEASLSYFLDNVMFNSEYFDTSDAAGIPHWGWRITSSGPGTYGSPSVISFNNDNSFSIVSSYESSGVLQTESELLTYLQSLSSLNTFPVQTLASSGYSAFSSICRPSTGAASGNLLVVFRQGQTHAADKGVLCTVRSSDKGFSWSAPVIVREHATLDLRDPGIRKLSDGRIAITYHDAVVAGSSTSGSTKIMFSSDDGYTWGDSITVTYPTLIQKAFSTAPVIETGNNTLLLVTTGRSTGNLQIRGAISSDGGLTWPTEVVVANGPVDGRAYQECNVERLQSGRLLAMLRAPAPSDDPIDPNETCIWRCFSDDYGLTWSSPQKMWRGHGSIRLVQLSNGIICTIYRSNLPSTGNRTALKVSYDNGVSWVTREVVADVTPHIYTYGSLVELDNKIATTYGMSFPDNVLSSVRFRYLPVSLFTHLSCIINIGLTIQASVAGALDSSITIASAVSGLLYSSMILALSGFPYFPPDYTQLPINLDIGPLSSIPDRFGSSRSVSGAIIDLFPKGNHPSAFGIGNGIVSVTTGISGRTSALIWMNPGTSWSYRIHYPAGTYTTEEVNTVSEIPFEQGKYHW